MPRILPTFMQKMAILRIQINGLKKLIKSSHGSISAYNLALSRKRNGDNKSYENLMEESIELGPLPNYSTMQAYGLLLDGQKMMTNDTRGHEYILLVHTKF